MKITNFPKPNYKVWDDVNILDQLQVVCLWAEFEPSIKASEEEICNAIRRFLTEARMEGLLRSDVFKEFINGELEYNVSFQRQDLKAYAEMMGLRPAFLYPETRTSLDASIYTDNSPPSFTIPPSKAKMENLPDSAVELTKIEDVQKVQSQSNENEQPVISENEYQKKFCDLYDPLPKKAILLIFPTFEQDLNRAIDRASRNGLGEARIGRGKFNPVKIASWLIQRGFITQHQADILLKKALPARSKHNPIADDYFNKDEID